MRTTARLNVVEPREQPRLVGMRTLRLLVQVRRNGYRLLAAAVAIGVLFMMIHWG